MVTRCVFINEGKGPDETTQRRNLNLNLNKRQNKTISVGVWRLDRVLAAET